MVGKETDKIGASDTSIDDLLSAFPDLAEDHVDCCSLAPLLLLDMISRPAQADEPLLWDAMLALEKALAEGTLAGVHVHLQV